MKAGGAPSNNNPYQGAGRVLLSNASTPDRVFGSAMPSTQSGGGSPINSTQVYGNSNYVNQNLQGYSQTRQNIITNDQLSGQMTPTTTADIEQMRRQQLVGNQLTSSQSYQQYQTQFPQSYPTITPSSANQMYMQPPVLPQINGMGGRPMLPNSQSTTGQQPVPATAPATPPLPPSDPTDAERNLQYLNSIAPASAMNTKSTQISPKLFVGLGVGVIILVVLISIAGAMGNTGSGLGTKSQQLGKDIANLQAIVNYGTSNVNDTSGSLNTVTAETNLVMLSNQSALSKHLTLALDDEGESTDAQPDEDTTAKLDNAKATGSLDDAYRQELRDRLSDVLNDTKSLYEAAQDSDTKSVIEKTYNDVNELIKRVDSSKSSAGGELVD